MTLPHENNFPFMSEFGHFLFSITEILVQIFSPHRIQDTGSIFSINRNSVINRNKACWRIEFHLMEFPVEVSIKREKVEEKK
jgi:hypothetical protein